MPTPTRLSLILILAALTAFGPLSIDMYLPAFPGIARDFGAPMDRVELSLTAFFAGLALGQLLFGTISDRFGRKAPLYAGLLLYIAASIACARAPGVNALIALRFVQALGGCAGMVISRASVRDLFDPREAARVFSLLMLVMGVAPILAPVIGGYVTQVWGWRAIFGIVAVFATACLLAVRFLLPETRGADPSVRLSRTFHTYGSILRQPHFLGYAVTGAAAQAGMFAYITGSPFVFIEHFGIPARHYGWVFGTNALGLIAVSQLNGMLLRKHAPEALLRVSSPLICGFGLLLGLASLLDAGLWGIALPLFLYVATLGAVFPNTIATALSRQGRQAGAASALVGTLQFTLAFASSAAVSLMHAHSARPMALTLAGCGLISWATHRWISRIRVS